MIFLTASLVIMLKRMAKKVKLQKTVNINTLPFYMTVRAIIWLEIGLTMQAKQNKCLYMKKLQNYFFGIISSRLNWKTCLDEMKEIIFYAWQSKLLISTTISNTDW